MDSITQAALGAAVGEAVLGRQLGNRALAWGALFGTLPDLDVIVSGFFDTAGNLAHHRGASHSLLVMVAMSLLLCRGLARLWKRDKVSRLRAGWFVFLAWSTHVLIDCFTVYGTSVWWPFSDHRVAFNHLFIIDGFFTLPLLGSVVWLAFLRGKKQLAKRRRVGRWGLILSGCYVVVSLLAKGAASAGFEADLARRGISYERRMEAPTPFNVLLWRGMVDRGDEIWVGYRSIFEWHSTPVRWTVYPRQREAFAAIADTREGRILHWFSDGWWIARPNRTGVWVADLRFGEMRDWEAREGMVDSRLPFSWQVMKDGGGDRLRSLRPDSRHARQLLPRLVWRLMGRKSQWESVPRLAGVPGSFPELLRVEE